MTDAGGLSSAANLKSTQRPKQQGKLAVRQETMPHQLTRPFCQEALIDDLRQAKEID
jgi:hypothetical protein